MKYRAIFPKNGLKVLCFLPLRVLNLLNQEIVHVGFWTFWNKS